MYNVSYIEFKNIRNLIIATLKIAIIDIAVVSWGTCYYVDNIQDNYTYK